MFVVRETFTAKPGQASKLAAMFKDIASGARAKMRVLTDAVGQFNTVVIETEVKELGDFEKLMKEDADRKDIRERMKGYTEMYASGKREIFRVM